MLLQDYPLTYSWRNPSAPPWNILNLQTIHLLSHRHNRERQSNPTSCARICESWQSNKSANTHACRREIPLRNHMFMIVHTPISGACTEILFGGGACPSLLFSVSSFEDVSVKTKFITRFWNRFIWVLGDAPNTPPFKHTLVYIVLGYSM